MATQTICDICASRIKRVGDFNASSSTGNSVSLMINNTSKVGNHIVVCSDCSDRAQYEFAMAFRSTMARMQEKKGKSKFWNERPF